MTGGITPPPPPPEERPWSGEAGHGGGGWEAPPPPPERGYGWTAEDPYGSGQGQEPGWTGQDPHQEPGWTSRPPGRGGPGWGGRPQRSGMEPNVASGLAYVLTIITGLIFLAVDRRPEVRFHAMQAIFFGIAWAVVGILRRLLDFFPLNLVLWLAWFSGLVFWVVLMVQGFQGNHFKLPYIGDLAEEQAGRRS